ncbi:tryptophan-rich sensory protein [Candidatus Aerophobetes bacterium]|nr:tryptophan-rich sensory protein [Candidatus Aerophobetes bacterium]
MTRIKAQDVGKLVASIALCQLAGVIGSIFTVPAIRTWYVTLKKPFFTPPNWVFSPVWITLYCLMGISLFLVWRKGVRTPGVKEALLIFAIQLILNALWSIAFFGFKSPLAGLVVIIILWVTILFTIISFAKVSRAAGLILIPYIVWVTIASALNASIFFLNM